MSELALRLIAENKKTRATFLDLGNCGLTKVPNEIEELVWLEGLSFASIYIDDKGRHDTPNSGSPNNISCITANLERLKRLKKLFLHDKYNGNRSNLNDLSPLSNLRGMHLPSISTYLNLPTSLTGLQELNVSNTQITELFPLSSLRGLQSLQIANTPVTDIWPLSSLRGLQELNIAGTLVTSIRPLSSLSNLYSFFATNTPIVDLSPLSKLSRLQRLFIGGTQVTDLSPLEGLSNLQRLSINKTQIATLSSLSGLSGLQFLFFSDTPVTDLSPLSGLIGLQVLDFRHTQITDLSPLSKLSGLQQFDVRNTLITDLSPLSGLSGLQSLDVSNTLITDLSPLLPLIESGLAVKWSPEVWGEYGIYVENCPLTNPPVAIVQQGNAAILNYFREKQTQGTDHIYEAKLLLVGEGGAGKTSLLRRLYQPQLPLPEENETTKGIAIHRHEFEVRDARYPNGRMFRLNVWDFGGQEIYHATHQFFLTQRSLYVLLDDTRKNHKTLLDDGFKYWLEAVDLLSSHSPVLIFQNEKGGRSKQIDLAGIKGGFDNVKDCYRGNLEQADGAKSLRAAIEYFAQNLPHIGEELPAQWLKIRADIEQLAELQATISQSVYFDLYQKYLPFDRDKALHLSRYLHDLGVFLHFQDDRLLARMVILQNQWATTAVFKVLDDETVKAQLGRFTADDCARLWQDSDYRDMHPELLALMQKFELCYALPDTCPETWLAPQLLPPSKPVALNDWAKPGDLVLRFCYEFLPKGMVSRLMVRQHHFVRQPELAWISGALFERDQTLVLVEIPPKGSEIVLRARGLERKELLSVLAADLDRLNSTCQWPIELSHFRPLILSHFSREKSLIQL